MKSQQFCGPCFGQFGVSTSRGRNFGIRSLFGVHYISLERYHRGDSFWGFNQSLQMSLRRSIPKNLHSGPQNGPESQKLLKIVNYQNCQKHVLGQLEKVGSHRYPPRSSQISVSSSVTYNLFCKQLIRQKFMAKIREVCILGF